MNIYFDRQRKALGLISVCCLILCFSGGQMIQAQEPLTLTHDLSTGSLTITSSDNGYNFRVTGTYTMAVTPTAPGITIKSDYSGTVILDNVTITNGTTGYNAMDIEGNTQVTLKLKGVNELKNTDDLNSSVKAVLKIATSTDLTIESYNGNDADGKLSVVQGRQSYSAALGTDLHTGTSGRVTINSGTIYTQGGDDGAGIGGGSQCAGGYITINGGDVTAICDSRAGGGNSGAGIGSGYNCSSNETYIRINGGKVTAVSLLRDGNGACGSAIGSGNKAGGTGGFGYIILAGGTIRASVRGYFDNADPCTACTPTGGGATYGGHNNPDGSLAGVGGVGIGGGTDYNVPGTIIVLPSANVTDVYGASWDIGNCQNIFYLNKKNLRVSAKVSGVQQTKVFTARTNPAQAGADILADIAIANQYLPAVASKAGTTGSSSPYIVGAASGNPDALYYYTNSDVTFFTQAKTTGNNPFALYTANTATSFNNLYPNESYNQYNASTNPYVYNVILDEATSPSYDIKLSAAYTPSATPPPAGTSDDLTIDFGTATYRRTGITGTYTSTQAFGILNAGAEWLDIKTDPSSTVESFTLEGPVVSPPEVEDGAPLPVGKQGEIIVTVKPRISVGNHSDTLVLKAFKANGDSIVRKITLKIKVEQEKVTGTGSAVLTATRPTLSPGVATKTNSGKVTLKARAEATDIDGVKTIWYQITDNATPTYTASSPGDVPDGQTDWTRVDVPPNSNGKYSYSYTFKPDFPSTDAVYYIHWYMETVNTIGSLGTISSYDVKRARPKPTITKTDGVNSIGVAPFSVTVKFDPDFDISLTPLVESMFSVSGGAIQAGPLAITGNPGEYTLTVQSDGANDVTIRFPENRVRDAWNNGNEASGDFTLPYSDGHPRADFSTINSVYFADQSSVTFGVSSENTDLTLYGNDGTTTLPTNAAAIVEVTKDGTAITPTVAFNSTGNEFTLTGTFDPGEYGIHIRADSIKNYLGNGIADTVYTFKVLKLGLSFGSGTHDFGRRHEDYAPQAPFGVTVTNSSGSVTVAGLSVAVTGANDTAFAANTGAMPPALSGGATTSFTVAPKTGLRADPATAADKVFTAKVTLMYHNLPVPGATFYVKFGVFKLQAPDAAIDFINETLINLAAGHVYSINRETPLTPAVDGSAPIAEAWMNGRSSTNEEIDEETGGRSVAQALVIPLRRAAPAGVSKRNVSDTGRNNGAILGVNDSMEYRRTESGDEAWTPVQYAGSLTDLPPGTYQVRYRAIYGEAFSSHILTLTILEQVIPRIDREIMLPAVPGVVTLPVPGLHYVASGEDFTFTLIFAGEPPTVKTSRTVEGVQEELAGKPDGNGGHTYTVRQVREAVAVTISGPASGAAADPDVAAVWAGAGHIFIRTPQAEPVDIYTVAGLLFRRLTTAPGAVASLPAAGGVYLIRFAGGKVHKVIVR